MAKTIKIKPKYVGCVVNTIAPTEFKRNVPNAGVFVLNDKLTDRELAYIHAITAGELTYEDKSASSL